MIPDRKDFQQTVQGKETDLYILRNGKNMEVAITNYGGRIVSVLVPDNKGVLTDVVAGYQNLSSYWRKDEPYFGALIGRYGNRIAHGKFQLQGKTYQLEINNGPNALHGGSGGFHARVWDVESLSKSQMVLGYFSEDGEEGYPGNLQVKVIYTLTDNNELKIDYHAETDKATIINLTNHSYFNLNGGKSETILNNILMINADMFIPVDANSIPLGHPAEVDGTPFDFKKAAPIGARINEKDQQLQNGNGYDHTFVLNKPSNASGLCAVAKGPETGIVMEVITTQPGVQFYSGNFLTGDANEGKEGNSYPRRSFFCLETQHFPDSPNHPDFPSTVLDRGEVFTSTTVYRFSVSH